MADGETTKGESAWIPFHVRNFDTRTLRLIRKDAYRRKISVQEWMRRILCRHYELDCDRSQAGPRPSTGATTLIVRLTPDLHATIKEDAEESGRSMQAIVHEILETPYRKKVA